MRLEGESAVIEAGRVFLPERAHWREDFVAELLAFPYGRFDDQVDSTSQFLAWAAAQHRRPDPGIPVGPKLFRLE